MICEVNRALYGLIESNQLWYLLLKKDLESIGYKVSPYDKCVFIKTVEYDNQIYRSTICLHVDDMLHTYNLKTFGKELNEFLIKMYSDITLQTGNSISYVGMQIVRDRKNRAITLNQIGYIESFLKKFNVHGTAKTPSTDALTKTTNDDANNIPADVDVFLSCVMTLMYLALRTRPDILFSVAYLSTKVKNPNQNDYKNLMRIFRYLNGTKDLVLKICPDNLQIKCWIDAAYATHDDMKSHSGYLIGLGNNGSLTFVRSSKQKLVTKSSTESELVALNDGISQVMWTRYYLEYQGYKQLPTIIFQDNMSTMFMANNGEGNHNNSKHINIRYFYIKELIDKNLIQLVHCDTDFMKADLMTKPKSGQAFKNLRQLIMNYDQ
jgi:hypothetical protein